MNENTNKDLFLDELNEYLIDILLVILFHL